LGLVPGDLGGGVGGGGCGVWGVGFGLGQETHHAEELAPDLAGLGDRNACTSKVETFGFSLQGFGFRV